MKVTNSKFIGSILGLAIGDALGYPAEFRSRAQILNEIGPDGITDFVALQDSRFSRPAIFGDIQPPGTYTDDTQMSIAVANGLLETHGATMDEKMSAIARHFVAWSNSPDNNRAPGATCMTGCKNLECGVHWSISGVSNSKGCGSAMRVAPIGLLYHDDLDQLCHIARASSLLTHGHPAALEGAVACALMVGLALQGAGPEEMYEQILSRCGRRSPDFDRCFERLLRCKDHPVDQALIDREAGGIGEAWVAEEAAASALFCYWRHPDDFRAAVLLAANTDGDSDSIAAITGSILGARLGVESIPDHWVTGVENTQSLQALGNALFEKM